MSMLGAIAGKLRDDALAIPRAIVGWHRNARYSIALYREGRIGLRQLVSPLVGTLGALVLVTALLFPVYWIAMASLQGTGASLYAADGLELIPSEPTLEAYAWVIGDVIIPGYRISIALFGYVVTITTPEIVIFEAADYGVENPSDFPRYAWNSMVVATVTVLVGMSVIIPASYALSRREFIMRKKILYGYILFTQVGGGLGIAMLIALFAIFAEIGATNSRVALGIYYAAMAVPFNTWLLKTFMDSIPPSYEEAAAVDGAPPWRIVWEVILPLSKPGLAAVFIFVFLAGWMEFIVAQTLLRPENYTLPVGLFALIDEYTVPWAQFSAFALTFAAPIVFIYLFVQRYIERGLSFGGMEG